MKIRYVLLAVMFICVMGYMGTGDFEAECKLAGGVVMQNGDCSK